VSGRTVRGFGLARGVPLSYEWFNEHYNTKHKRELLDLHRDTFEDDPGGVTNQSTKWDWRNGCTCHRQHRSTCNLECENYQHKIVCHKGVNCGIHKDCGNRLLGVSEEELKEKLMLVPVENMGQGLATRVPLRKGTLIAAYVGQLVDLGTKKDDYDASYCLQTGVVKSWLQNQQYYCRGKVRDKKSWTLEGKNCLAAMANQGCGWAANCKVQDTWYVCNRELWPLSVLTCTKELDANTELTWFYNITSETTWTCGCAKCAA